MLFYCVGFYWCYWKIWKCYEEEDKRRMEARCHSNTSQKWLSSRLGIFSPAPAVGLLFILLIFFFFFFFFLRFFFLGKPSMHLKTGKKKKNIAVFIFSPLLVSLSSFHIYLLFLKYIYTHTTTNNWNLKNWRGFCCNRKVFFFLFLFI